MASIPLDAAPQAAGVRSLGDAWLWVQPPDRGPYIDQVVMRFADKVVVVSVSNVMVADTRAISAGPISVDRARHGAVATASTCPQ